MLKKNIIIFVILLILATIAFLFFKSYFLTINARIEPQKESYNIGDTIVIKTTITNFAPWPYKKTFSSTYTNPTIKVEGINFSPSSGVLAGAALTDVNIKPFNSTTYSNSLNLVTSKEIGLDSSNRDLVVKPEKNTIEIIWGKTKKINIYVNPKSFSETPLACDEFESANRKNDCYLENTKSIEDCLKISEDWKKDFCLDKIIMKTEDYKYCENMVQDWRRQSCFKTAAEKTKDPKYCDKLTEQAKEGFCSLFEKIKR